MFRSNLIWIREQSKFKILDKKKKKERICNLQNFRSDITSGF